MFTLLPETEKKGILREYHMRRAIIAFFFLFALGCVTFIFLIPSHLLSSSRSREILGRVEAVQKSTIVADADEIESKLLATNLKLQIFKGGGMERGVSGAFEKVLSYKTASIRIHKVEFRHGEKEGDEIVLSGIAQNRDALSVFVRALEGEPAFSRVIIPVSDFARDLNANFTITIRTTL